MRHESRSARTARRDRAAGFTRTEHRASVTRSRSAQHERDRSAPATQRRRRLLVVSHPAVVNVNQEVYRELQRRGWEVTIVVPSRWRSEYSQAHDDPAGARGHGARAAPHPVVLPGRPQRHVYLTQLPCAVRPERAPMWRSSRPSRTRCRPPSGAAPSRAGHPVRRAVLREHRPGAAGCRCAGLRSRVLRRRGVRGRPLGQRRAAGARLGSAGRGRASPPPCRCSRDARQTIRRRLAARGERPFTVGYAGRLVESKGLTDLLAAVRMLQAPVELLLIGDGELRAQLEGQPIPGSRVRVLDGLAHEQMAAGLRAARRAGAALAHDAHLEGAVRAGDRRGAVVRRAGGRLGLGRDPVADRADRRWADLSRGRQPGAGRAIERAARVTRAAPAVGEQGRAAVERLFSVPAATDAFERLLVGALQPKS